MINELAENELFDALKFDMEDTDLRSGKSDRLEFPEPHIPLKLLCIASMGSGNQDTG